MLTAGHFVYSPKPIFILIWHLSSVNFDSGCERGRETENEDVELVIEVAKNT